MQLLPPERLNTGRDIVFGVGEVRYVAVHENNKLIPSLNREFSLATVFTLTCDQNPSEVTATWVQEQVARYSNEDDVFNEQFLATVIFHVRSSQDESIKVTDEAHIHLRGCGTEQVVCTSEPQLLPGPFAIVGSQLRDVWKLVDDVNGTCMVTLNPNQNANDGFKPFPVLSSDDRFSSFALPSRITSRATSNSLFAGMRILVKDNIHLKGIKTSVGNRAFYETYPPQPETAECVKRLIDQGAVILGKTKMNSFATWEESVEYIDYQAPWNPRADHHQSPGGSSSGSASAVATYDWLDMTIGTDISCSSVKLVTSFEYIGVFDTAGILGTDLRKCRDFAAKWLRAEVLQKNPKPFSLVLFPLDFWKAIDPKQANMGREFAQLVVAHLKADYLEISFEELWLESPPKDAQGCTLSEYIDWAAKVQDYDAYHNCDDFRKKYQKTTGHAPYVSPPVQKAWAFAQTISKDKRDKGFEHIKTYKEWFETQILSTATGNVLVVMPIESMNPRYRDESPKFEYPPPGINALTLAPVLEAPAITIPIKSTLYFQKPCC
ncbi:hypothetical protein ONS95_001980 [Cadophora gregata]|uniref:uncharacterized protein n=1 Tax=Cadophora gregata TaxID=51156 RepID=UPI0026DD2D17|nr:uncharacterized protein ONS95_001980 [Cadophora gregata]KAK0111635.1 hypothetical protein ONS95_001980 [Cadophora gregata]